MRRTDALDLFAGSIPYRVKENMPPCGQSHDLSTLPAESGSGVSGVIEIFGGVMLHLTGVLVQIVAHRGVPKVPCLINQGMGLQQMRHIQRGVIGDICGLNEKK